MAVKINEIVTTTSINTDDKVVVTQNGTETRRANAKDLVDKFTEGIKTNVSNLTKTVQDNKTEILNTIGTEEMGTTATTIKGAVKELGSQLNENVNKIVNFYNENNKTNSSYYYNFNTMLNALHCKNCKVTFFGDSITEYSDAITEDIIYPRLYMERLKSNFPNVNFEYNNRAIRGTTIDDAENETYIPEENNLRPWTIGNTKSWKQIIWDTKPDVLFIAFGMNRQKDIHSFNIKLNSIINYVNRWEKVPTIILVTTPLPAIVYGGQEDRKHNARVTREYAFKNNLFCVDAYHMLSVLRDGNDEKTVNPYLYKNFDSINWEFDSGISGNDTLKSLPKNTFIHSKFNCLNFNICFKADIQNDTIIRINFKGSTLLFLKDTVKFYLYEEHLIYTINVEGFVVGNHKIGVETINSKLQVWLDDILIYEYDNLYYDYRLNEINFGVESTATTIYDFNFIDYKFNKITKMATDEMLFGKYVNGDYGTKLPFGGNGVNHPSSLGLKLMYYNYIEECIKVLKNEMQSNLYIYKLIKQSDWKQPSISSGWELTTEEGLNIYYVFIGTKTSFKFNNIKMIDTNSFTIYEYKNDYCTKISTKKLKENQFAIVCDGENVIILIAKDEVTNIPSIELYKSEN